MTEFYWTHVKQHKNGADRMCVRCSIERARRRAAAVVTAFLRNDAAPKYKLPVGYCEEHIPDELEEQL